MPQPLAIWNSARDVWETPQTEGLFCEHLDVYSETWPTSGSMRNGVAYELPMWEPATDVSASSSLLLTPVASEGEKATFQQGSAQRSLTGQPFLTNQIRDVYDLNSPLLKTPTSQLAVNGGSQHPDKRKAGGHGPTLADEVEHLLPTPKASGGEKGGPNQRGSSGDYPLPAIAHLLPTPSACVANDGESTATWLARRERVKLTAANGNGMGMPLTIASLLIGENTPPPSPAGNQLWEDVPLPLPNPQGETEATA